MGSLPKFISSRRPLRHTSWYDLQIVKPSTNSMSEFNLKKKKNFSTNYDNNPTARNNLNEVELYDLLGTKTIQLAHPQWSKVRMFM